jgi:hypothetical protein
MKKLLFLTSLFVAALYSSGQHLGATIQNAEKLGITIHSLDNIYRSAVHSDTSQAVFKTDSAQGEVVKAYTKLLQDLGTFLADNNFKWNKPVKCWNRIYFDCDGTIDYFLYNFLKKNINPGDLLSLDQQTEFNRLLNLFIRNYKFSLTAKTKFAQCSSATYMPADEIDK